MAVSKKPQELSNCCKAKKKYTSHEVQHKNFDRLPKKLIYLSLLQKSLILPTIPDKSIIRCIIYRLDIYKLQRRLPSIPDQKKYLNEAYSGRI